MKKHFSLSDWDLGGDGVLELDAAQYVSAPTSLRFQMHPTTFQQISWFFLKTALSGVLAEGKFLSWIRAQRTNEIQSYIFFRAQDLPTNGWCADSYYVRYRYNNWTLIKRVGASDSTLDTAAITPNLEANTWYQTRVTFYNYTDAHMAPIFRIIIEIKREDEWEVLCTYDDTDPLWADSEVNRIGYRGNGSYEGRWAWVDDTEVWRKTS